MADSLVLHGVKDVRKHTGTEMVRLAPRGGGDVFRLKCWWLNGQVSTTYVTATVFQVTTADGTVKLAVDSSVGTNLRIDHDGSFNFNFYHPNEVSRAALFTDSFELIEHYVFPKISGGKIMLVTPPNPASRPDTSGDSATSVDDVVIVASDGTTTATVGDIKTYNATVQGNATPFTYDWTIVGGTLTANNVQQAEVTWSVEGEGSVSCVVGGSGENYDDSTASDTFAVTVAAAPAPEPEPDPEPTFQDKVDAADQTFAVTVVDNGGDEFALNGNVQSTVLLFAGDTVHFDVSDASVSGHPLKIYTDASKTAEVTEGFEQEGTDILFTPAAAGTYSYQCANHEAMGGLIEASDPA